MCAVRRLCAVACAKGGICAPGSGCGLGGAVRARDVEIRVRFSAGMPVDGAGSEVPQSTRGCYDT